RRRSPGPPARQGRGLHGAGGSEPEPGPQDRSCRLNRPRATTASVAPSRSCSPDESRLRFSSPPGVDPAPALEAATEVDGGEDGAEQEQESHDYSQYRQQSHHHAGRAVAPRGGGGDSIRPGRGSGPGPAGRSHRAEEEHGADEEQAEVAAGRDQGPD